MTLVNRRVYAEVPPRVEYSLTEFGQTLNTALKPLGEWGRERITRERREMVDNPDASGMPHP
ncbi:winged helix-turn-helix transcriptional regulator [Nonomuraea diastatica]|uniref:Transcriptional regulator n=1 Tax=Nonomuraea diastatica TaxID=1848329 RepID=A0A4R4WVF7_9ACTN|nr:transcriptional regulator [Nonomuraea diastatica]